MHTRRRRSPSRGCRARRGRRKNRPVRRHRRAATTPLHRQAPQVHHPSTNSPRAPKAVAVHGGRRGAADIGVVAPAGGANGVDGGLRNRLRRRHRRCTTSRRARTRGQPAPELTAHPLRHGTRRRLLCTAAGLPTFPADPASPLVPNRSPGTIHPAVQTTGPYRHWPHHSTANYPRHPSTAPKATTAPAVTRLRLDWGCSATVDLLGRDGPRTFHRLP